MKLVVVGISALLMGCATVSPRQLQNCARERRLVVRNNTPTSVDVHAFSGRSSWILGIASPGRAEFALEGIPADASFAASRDGQRISFGNGSAGREVEFSVACRGMVM